MTTKANGLLYADYARAMKAAKKCGAKTVRVDPDGAITFSFDDNALDKLNGDIEKTEAEVYALKSAKLKLDW
jgi:hypothetical protein